MTWQVRGLTVQDLPQKIIVACVAAAALTLLSPVGAQAQEKPLGKVRTF
jgi:hypothetical protein